MLFVALNLLPAILGLIFYREGFICDFLVGLVSFCIIFVNHMAAERLREAFICDAILLIVTGCVEFYTIYLYLKNVSGDDLSETLGLLFFWIWLIGSITWMMLLTAWHFLKQKNRK